MAKNLVSINLDNTEYSLRPYGTCFTAAATVAKTVSITGFTLCSGATVLVNFSNSNTIANPTLNVNGTGDKPIIHLGHRFDPNIYYEFIYNGSNWAQIGEEKYRCSVSSGNQNNYPWHRIAYTDVLPTEWIRRTSILVFNQAVFAGKYGELALKVTTNNTNQNASYEAYWIVNKGFNEDDIKIGINNTYGNTYFDVFYKCPGTWSSLLIEQKTGGYDSHFTKSFTLCSSQEVSNTTTTDKLTSFECYATIESAAAELHNTEYTAIISPNTSSGTLQKISFNGDLTGNAATATNATNADKLNNLDSSYFATASKQIELENQIKSLASGLVLDLTASPSTIYKNESKSITLTATVKDTAGNVNATSIVIKDGSTELKSVSNTYTTNVSKSISTNNNTYTFAATAVVNGMTLNKNVSVSARNAVYYGMGVSASAVKTNGSKASARTSAVSNTTYDAIASSDGERFYLLVPSDVTRPTSFSMGGAPVDMVIPSSTTNIDGIAYYVFYTNATYNSGGGVQIKAQ